MNNIMPYEWYKTEERILNILYKHLAIKFWEHVSFINIYRSLSKAYKNYISVGVTQVSVVPASMYNQSIKI